jgi:ribose 5-phosphate isomerase B
MKISIGSDHAGFELKNKLKDYMEEKGYEVDDVGAFSSDRSDYPDYAHAVAEAVSNKAVDMGVLICGSGVGMDITANKHHNVRAALCWNNTIAGLARQHNDANIISLPARFMNEEEAEKCVDSFLTTPFEGGRHSERVRKIENE